MAFLLKYCYVGGGGGRERVKQEEFLFDGEGKVATCSLD